MIVVRNGIDNNNDNNDYDGDHINDHVWILEVQVLLDRVSKSLAH